LNVFFLNHYLQISFSTLNNSTTIMIITICICGAGTMGSGIAQVAAQSGFATILFDVNETVLDSR
jgi:UDP-N-acetyl-D-mannosaminuronate dehydrogenase